MGDVASRRGRGNPFVERAGQGSRQVKKKDFNQLEYNMLGAVAKIQVGVFDRDWMPEPNVSER